ncbi:hypothetical protein [Frigoribacterium sp. VKM Ac-2836]|uniref:hypothetical protein n=1 Tax=Frigoribacterium sp. VKM Ac-2836 TaxID=2739014 RepID=UPI0015637E65|nr:hypothetical protein [Frigoribacterium sp. VKM Ac-2836]NRD27730.1 hypothetical protein [Frigoribacterium sp. VKM Ac-2836]
MSDVTRVISIVARTVSAVVVSGAFALAVSFLLMMGALVGSWAWGGPLSVPGVAAWRMSFPGGSPVVEFRVSGPAPLIGSLTVWAVTTVVLVRSGLNRAVGRRSAPPNG